MQFIRQRITTVVVLTFVMAALSISALAASSDAQVATSPMQTHGTPTASNHRATPSRHPKNGTATKTEVKIDNFKFGPAVITIKAGTTVVWTNKDAIAHSVNFKTIKLNSKTLGEGHRFTHTFTAPGTFAYICAIHPFMHGTVVVTA